MKRMAHIRVMLALCALVSMAQVAEAQCRTFTKHKCMKTLEGYVGNGQYNGAVMFEGEEASLLQTFYSGQQYRIAVCCHELLAEDMYFEVHDYQKNMLYSSRESSSGVFDFNVESTQQLRIRIVVTESKHSTGKLKRNGCVSVLVGFKNTLE